MVKLIRAGAESAACRAAEMGHCCCCCYQVCPLHTLWTGAPGSVPLFCYYNTASDLQANMRKKQHLSCQPNILQPVLRLHCSTAGQQWTFKAASLAHYRKVRTSNLKQGYANVPIFICRSPPCVLYSPSTKRTGAHGSSVYVCCTHLAVGPIVHLP